tara:strand:- start:689 stop:1045 length:357 start_codon:yes stop_codon:yes gene_type:complete
MADEVIVPRRKEDFFDNRGEPTLRYVRFLESITSTTNTGSAAIDGNTQAIAANTALINVNISNIAANTQSIEDAAYYSGFGPQIQFLQKQINGLPEFTIDTSGFTFDSTKITFDKVIA